MSREIAESFKKANPAREGLKFTINQLIPFHFQTGALLNDHLQCSLKIEL